MKRDMVTLISTAMAVTTVSNANGRFNVHTNPEDPNVAELELDRPIAVQLVAAGVGLIDGETKEETLGIAEADAVEAAEEAAASGQLGGTIERAAARRLRRSLEADNAGGSRVSGADTRDTTAHRRNPLGGAERSAAGGAESDEAPLTGAGAKAPGAKPKRKRKSRAKKPAAAKAAGAAQTKAPEAAADSAPA